MDSVLKSEFRLFSKIVVCPVLGTDWLKVRRKYLGHSSFANPTIPKDCNKPVDRETILMNFKSLGKSFVPDSATFRHISNHYPKLFAISPFDLFVRPNFLSGVLILYR